MAKWPLILTCILISAWGYTSWNWYVCNIKGLCENTAVASEDDDTMMRYDDVTGIDMGSEDESSSTGNVVSGSGELYSSPKLSAGDVLIANPEPKKAPEVQEDIVDEEDEIAETLSGTTTEESTETEVEDSKSDVSTQESVNLCSFTLVGPVSYGGLNKKLEVEFIEKFLISRGASLEVNGEYGQEDFEEMKKFQLEFKAEILDPWDITAPTGYVGRTTVKKINELACQ